MQKGCLQQGKPRTARNRLDFVSAANRLYGASIRGARAPASLKAHLAGSIGMYLSTHPGRARPGLIEGRLFGEWFKVCDGHPGRARPGLIEGELMHVDEARKLGGIRGARAPASLKEIQIVVPLIIRGPDPRAPEPATLPCRAQARAHENGALPTPVLAPGQPVFLPPGPCPSPSPSPPARRCARR